MAPDASPSPARSHAILLTARQPAAIATIRLAGPAVPAFAAMYLDKPMRPHQCVHCNLFNEAKQTIDDVVAVLVDAMTIDLSVHGGVWVVQSVLDLAGRAGFEKTDWRTAPPSLIADSEDPIEQQMMIDLPRAATREALTLLLAQPAAWRELMSTQDEGRLRRALADRSLEWLLTPPTVALIGAPNVGKSTLANQLFARDRSITADLPGTTRDWVGERANLDGLIVTLVDTPGQRLTSDALEAAAIARALPVVDRADLVVIVLDASRGLDETERSLLLLHPNAIVVGNKTDVAHARPAADVTGALSISAKSGAGVAALRERIRERFGCADLRTPSARCWTADQRSRIAQILQDHTSRRCKA